MRTSFSELKRSNHVSFNMPREVEPSLNEKAFVLQALRENIRTDGRGFDTFRKLELQFGEDHGVADVQLGRTRWALEPKQKWMSLADTRGS